MLKTNEIGLKIFCTLLIIFYVIPESVLLQKPMRIFMGLFFLILYIYVPISQQLRRTSLLAIIALFLIGVIMLYRGTFMTSYANSFLCFAGIMCIPKFLFDSRTEIKKLQALHLLCAVAIVIQFLIFTSHDGRPSLGYEINLSAAYLFLFFLFSDALNIKWGKVFVLVLSLLILSRLLIFSIAIFYIVRIIKKRFVNIFKKINIAVIIISVYVLFGAFSIWYVHTFRPVIAYETSVKRVLTINDGSNSLRLKANKNTIEYLASDLCNINVLLGLGNLEKNADYLDKVVVMPHNELLSSILEYGIIVVFIFALFSILIIQKYVGYYNVEYFFSILFYTLILWVHYLLIPSFEMIFIIFILNFTRLKFINE